MISSKNQNKNHVIYVADNGNDAWSGTLPLPNEDYTEGPLATLAAARDAVRALKKSGASGRPVHVVVREGTYFMTEPFTLHPQDSGTAEAPVVYKAFWNEKPVLSGGRRLSNWTSLGDNLWKTDVQNINGMPWRFRQLFISGVRYVRARIPEEGKYFRITGEMVTGDKESEMNKSSFHFEAEDIPPSLDLDNAELVTLHRWETSRLKIAKIDREQLLVHVGNPAFWSFLKGKRYYIENVREGLVYPYSWYLDTDASVLWVHAPEGLDLNKAEVNAPAISQLVRFEGRPQRDEFVRHIRFSGFDLCCSDWELPSDGSPGYQAACDEPGVIYAQGACYCTVENNTIHGIGAYGIEFGCGCRENRIAGNEIHDMGAGGVKVGEKKYKAGAADQTSGNEITDNTIHDGGKVMAGAVGIWVGQSSRNLISHNEVFDMDYTGISVGWTWSLAPNNHRDNIIEYNHLHHLMRHTLSDGGGIYLLGVSPGTVVHHNLIHDVFAYSEDSGRGIYLDESSTGVLVEKNIVYRISAAPMRLQLGTCCNIIVNNIFAFGKLFQLAIDTDRSNCFEKNIIYWDTGTNVFSRKVWERFDTIFDYNVYWYAGAGEPQFLCHSFKEWQKIRGDGRNFFKPDGMDAHSILSDPLFIAPEQGDFLLMPDSPAFGIGFEPFSLDDAGPRKK